MSFFFFFSTGNIQTVHNFFLNHHGHDITLKCPEFSESEKFEIKWKITEKNLVFSKLAVTKKGEYDVTLLPYAFPNAAVGSKFNI